VGLPPQAGGAGGERRAAGGAGLGLGGPARGGVLGRVGERAAAEVEQRQGAQERWQGAARGRRRLGRLLERRLRRRGRGGGGAPDQPREPLKVAAACADQVGGEAQAQAAQELRIGRRLAVRVGGGGGGPQLGAAQQPCRDQDAAAAQEAARAQAERAQDARQPARQAHRGARRRRVGRRAHGSQGAARARRGGAHRLPEAERERGGLRHGADGGDGAHQPRGEEGLHGRPQARRHHL